MNMTLKMKKRVCSIRIMKKMENIMTRLRLKGSLLVKSSSLNNLSLKMIKRWLKL